VVVFLGRPGDGLEPYWSWIRHTVLGGAAVVALTDYGPGAPNGWSDHAADALRAALFELASISSTRVRTEQLAFVGHDGGASVAADLAATWYDRRLPEPKVLMMIEPKRAKAIVTGDLQRTPNDTKVLFVALAEDSSHDAIAELLLWDGLRHVPGAWRQRLILHSDRHGLPSLVASGDTPLTDPPLGQIDALDWFGTWKWLDGLTECAFYGRYCEYALGDTSQQRFMGQWADGRPVRRAEFSEGPPRPDTSFAYLPAVRN
jgi:hypothetical protein